MLERICKLDNKKYWFLLISLITLIIFFFIFFDEAIVLSIICVGVMFFGQELSICFGKKNNFTKLIETQGGTQNNKTKAVIIFSRLFVFTSLSFEKIRAIIKAIPQEEKVGIFDDYLLELKDNQECLFLGTMIQKISVYNWFSLEEEKSEDKKFLERTITLVWLGISVIFISSFGLGFYNSTLENKQIKIKYTKPITSNRFIKKFYGFGYNITKNIDSIIFEEKKEEREE